MANHETWEFLIPRNNLVVSSEELLDYCSGRSRPDFYVKVGIKLYSVLERITREREEFGLTNQKTTDNLEDSKSDFKKFFRELGFNLESYQVSMNLNRIVFNEGVRSLVNHVHENFRLFSGGEMNYETARSFTLQVYKNTIRNPKFRIGMLLFDAWKRVFP